MSSMIFCGLEGSNPLGFLAALGALRLCDLLWPDRKIRLRWIRERGWRPEALGLPIEEPAELCRTLHEKAHWMQPEAFAALGNNLTVERERFEGVIREAARNASFADRRAADFSAAFGSEVFEEDKGKRRIQYTDLCFVTGSGHQHFLGAARGLAESTRPEHLREALFGPWRYADKSQSLRWDPEDAKEYALRWADPSSEGAYTVWGANRLAFEALPLFPTVPAARGLLTTGFRRQKGTREFTWPIWSQPCSVDTVRSLVGMRELLEDAPDRGRLEAMGVDDIFRARRVRIGQGANFKLSFRPARAV